LTPRVRRRRADETERLFDIWHRAVAATHSFLAPDDFRTIATVVREQYLPTAELWVAVDHADRPLGFLGMTGSAVDALFVDPDEHGRGIGRALMAHAAGLADRISLDVNEQNETALAFYRRLGFEVVGRSERDGAGMPYPLLHLKARG
jgi:putative acetyltransferase